MVAIVEAISIFNAQELVSLVWMEVTMACLASLVWFTVSGIVASPKPQRSNKFERFEEEEPVQECVCLPVEENFDKAMAELKTLQGKIESRGIEDVIPEAVKNEDMAACQQLQTSPTTMLISKTAPPLEPVAHVHASDIASLRILAPLARGFAAVVLDACAGFHDIDLAQDVAGKADAAALRAKHRAPSRRIRFSRQSEVSFFSLPPPENAFRPFEYRRLLDTKVFDGPSGHKAMRTSSSETKASTHWCEDEVSLPRTRWDRSVSETSLDGEDFEDWEDFWLPPEKLGEDVEDWEDRCDDIAELMAQQRSCLLWSPL